MKATLVIDCNKDLLGQVTYDVRNENGIALGTAELVRGIPEKLFKREEETIPISFIRKILGRDICLVYRGCLLMLLEKWREENE